nr:hypothetical protein [Leucobacter coleopterorum]
MNVVVSAQADALARAGHRVYIYTRRSDEALPERVELPSGSPSCISTPDPRDYSQRVSTRV